MYCVRSILAFRMFKAVLLCLNKPFYVWILMLFWVISFTGNPNKLAACCSITTVNNSGTTFTFWGNMLLITRCWIRTPETSIPQVPLWFLQVYFVGKTQLLWVIVRNQTVSQLSSNQHDNGTSPNSLFSTSIKVMTGLHSTVTNHQTQYQIISGKVF